MLFVLLCCCCSVLFVLLFVQLAAVCATCCLCFSCCCCCFFLCTVFLFLLFVLLLLPLLGRRLEKPTLAAFGLRKCHVCIPKKAFFISQKDFLYPKKSLWCVVSRKKLLYPQKSAWRMTAFHKAHGRVRGIVAGDVNPQVGWPDDLTTVEWKQPQRLFNMPLVLV